MGKTNQNQELCERYNKLLFLMISLSGKQLIRGLLKEYTDALMGQLKLMLDALMSLFLLHCGCQNNMDGVTTYL